MFFQNQTTIQATMRQAINGNNFNNKRKNRRTSLKSKISKKTSLLRTTFRTPRSVRVVKTPRYLNISQNQQLNQGKNQTSEKSWTFQSTAESISFFQASNSIVGNEINEFNFSSLLGFSISQYGTNQGLFKQQQQEKQNNQNINQQRNQLTFSIDESGSNLGLFQMRQVENQQQSSQSQISVSGKFFFQTKEKQTEIKQFDAILELGLNPYGTNFQLFGKTSSSNGQQGSTSSEPSPNINDDVSSA